MWRIKNTHKERLYLQLAFSGNPAKMPANRDDAIALSRDLFEADGKSLKSRALKVGESVIVRINVNPRSWVNTGMVVDHIPAGLEIENLNIAQGEGMASTLINNVNPAEAMQDPRIQHVEFRDDRFVVAARLQGKLSLFYPRPCRHSRQVRLPADLCRGYVSAGCLRSGDRRCDADGDGREGKAGGRSAGNRANASTGQALRPGARRGLAEFLARVAEPPSALAVGRAASPAATGGP